MEPRPQVARLVAGGGSRVSARGGPRGSAPLRPPGPLGRGFALDEGADRLEERFGGRIGMKCRVRGVAPGAREKRKPEAG